MSANNTYPVRSAERVKDGKPAELHPIGVVRPEVPKQGSESGPVLA
jgi:hypothetical protein